LALSPPSPLWPRVLSFKCWRRHDGALRLIEQRL
jgi:hypothetical protein